jgi:hypothetical protein
MLKKKLPAAAARPITPPRPAGGSRQKAGGTATWQRWLARSTTFLLSIFQTLKNTESKLILVLLYVFRALKKRRAKRHEYGATLQRE